MTLIIEEIDLNITIPELGLCMAYMQPFVELTDTEPYRWKLDNNNQQLDRISRFMNIAKRFDGNGKTHFTVLPEYSIPGLVGVERINQFLLDPSWDSETVVIGGVDGLNKDEYRTLCSNEISRVFIDNLPDNIPNGNWINCCITWVKDRDGRLKRWIQPKLSPSWAERNIMHSRMFCGRSVSLFTIKYANDTPCKFMSLICFDWIGAINSAGNGINGILNQINQLWQNTGSRKDINMVFMLQHNEEPNHRNFLENARNFFEDRVSNQFVVRDQSILFFVNTAGIDRPGKSVKYGYSSLIASPSSPYDCDECCPLSFSSDASKLRNSNNLGRCKEALFRENGACCHLFKFRSPSFISSDPGNRCQFLDEAKVYPIDDGVNDSRVPRGSVAASVKWINDGIDSIEPILAHENSSHIKEDVARSHENLSRDIRRASGDFLCEYIRCSFSKYENFCQDSIPIIHFVDKWNGEEKEGLHTVVYVLSILGTCKSINVSGAGAHAVMTIGSNIIDIIVVHGGNTHEECFEYAKGFLNSQSRYGIVITKDVHDTLTDTKINRSILNTQEPISERGPSITNPDDRFIHHGYQNIRNCCFSATSVDNLRAQIDGLLGV